MHGACLVYLFLLLLLLPAVNSLGHECQGLWSLCNGMRVCIGYTSVYTLTRKSFVGNGVGINVNSKGKKIPCTGGSEKSRSRMRQDSEPKTLPTLRFTSFARVVSDLFTTTTGCIPATCCTLSTQTQCSR